MDQLLNDLRFGARMLVKHLALAGTCLLAILVPARRALKVDPVVALRYE